MNTEIKRLQGTWNIVSLEVNGVPLGESHFHGSKILIEGNTFRTVSMGSTYQGIVQVEDAASVDISTAPLKLDLIFTEGPHQGKASPAIYELNGDTWKLCLALAGGGTSHRFRHHGRKWPCPRNAPPRELNPARRAGSPMPRKVSSVASGWLSR